MSGQAFHGGAAQRGHLGIVACQKRLYRIVLADVDTEILHFTVHQIHLVNQPLGGYLHMLVLAPAYQRPYGYAD